MGSPATARLVEPVDDAWLVTFVNAFASQAQAGAQPGTAVTVAEAERGRPSVVARVPRTERERIAGLLWRVFADDAGRVETLAALVNEAGLRPAIQVDGTLRWSHDATGRDARFLAGCAATVLDLVTARGWDALGVCAAEDCQDVHLAPPRGRPRRFCTTSCLNRSKARDHRARSRADRTPEDR